MVDHDLSRYRIMTSYVLKSIRYVLTIATFHRWDDSATGSLTMEQAAPRMATLVGGV